MIIHCRDDLYHGHWCPVCGMCRCFEAGQFGGKRWTGKTAPSCPMHGKHTKHGKSKLVDWRFDANGKGRPDPSLDGWDAPDLGTRDW